MRILCISDTHGKHRQLEIPSAIDMILFAGDAGTYQNPSMNEAGVRDFLDWYGKIEVKHKILVFGNHDGSVEAGLITRGDIPESLTYLSHESTEIEGLRIFGSEFTPSFGQGWAYNVPRGRLEQYWKEIPEGTDIVITHGPCYKILDLTESGNEGLVHVGCKSLLNRINYIEPKFHICGHLHDEGEAYNAGIFKPTALKTTFVNAAVLNLKYNLCNNGVIIDI